MSSNQTANEDEDGLTQRVKYDTKSHFNVLTQMHGSIWPSVLPHCILNTLNICGIILLDRWYSIDLSYSDKGHTFMSMIVSFLVVTRSSIAYSRFMESRSHLAQVMKSCRELMQYAVTFTRYDNSDAATKWRYMVARKTIVLLRTLVCVLEFPTKGELVWKNKVLTREEQADLKNAVGEDNERSVMYLVMALRKTIGSSFESLNEPLHPNRELKLYAFVSEFVTGYHGLTKLIDTPFPFPLAQMTATFIFIWVYTLPAVLYNDEVAVPALLTIVFFITYAFIGLEYVSIELDDPFGNDPTDFDVLGLTQVVFQDIYICIYDADGDESAKKVKNFFEIEAMWVPEPAVSVRNLFFPGLSPNKNEIRRKEPRDLESSVLSSVPVAESTYGSTESTKAGADEFLIPDGSNQTHENSHPLLNP